MCYVVSVSYFNDICFYTMMGGLLSSFLSGMVYDWQKKVCKSKFFFHQPFEDSGGSVVECLTQDQVVSGFPEPLHCVLELYPLLSSS